MEHRRLLAIALAVAVTAVLLAPRLLHHGATHVAIPRLRTATHARAPAVAQLVIDVAGAVRRPGIYHLAAGTRIADAVAAAGGATVKADVTLVNLAAPLADGEQVVVPARIPGGQVPAASSGGSAPAGPVSLSTATAEQLDGLPGIGPVTAQKIVDYRTQHGAFHSVDELDAISGIGPAKLDQLRGLVVP